MAKGHKSSATAATRKKHALKAAGGAKQELPLPKEKKKDKGKGKKEPRVKVFIPPSKPAPVRPDPLDSLGIAKQIPPELLVVLRRLGKKDTVTRRKALEELQSGWIDKILNSKDEDGIIESTLNTSLPVWVWYTVVLQSKTNKNLSSFITLRRYFSVLHGESDCLPLLFRIHFLASHLSTSR